MRISLAAGFCLLASTVRAADGPVFEVASVRPTSTELNAPIRCFGGPGTASPGRLTCTRAPLAMLISMAYDVQFYQISGPDWINYGGDGVDISAIVPADATREDFRAMLRNLLADRFHLVVRQENRQMDVYALRLAGKEPKMKPGAPQLPPIRMQILNGQYLAQARGATMSALAGFLTAQLRAPVQDETMLSAAYDFVLQFTPENLAADNPDTVPLRSALVDQLGLRLASTKGPVAMIVVADALRKPTEN